jgi:thiosulfate dehydrogenase [quinone] large subunit
MFTHWLRSNKWAAGILTVLRIYLGWQFLNAGWEKLTGAKAFSAAGFLANSIQHPVLGPTKNVVYPTFDAFLKNFSLPHIGLFNFLVPWGEFLVGVGLIVGTLTTAAVFFGMLMNFMYMFAGTVSTNPLDVLLGSFILVAGFNAGRYGGDYWVIPWIRKHVAGWFSKEVAIPTIRGKKSVH